MLEPIIQLKKVIKVYPSAVSRVPALKGIDLEVQPGEFVGIIGRSGAGKTTLVNLMAGIDRVTSGEIQVAGTQVHSLSEERLATWRGQNLGIIYQSFQLLPELSILDNILLPIDLCGHYSRRQSPARAQQLLDQVELSAHAHKKPSAISGGQQQRVAIARALANDPPIILADEPTGRLDSATAEIIFQIFLGLSAQGKTILMVTHDGSLARRVSRVVRLVDGVIV